MLVELTVNEGYKVEHLVFNGFGGHGDVSLKATSREPIVESTADILSEVRKFTRWL